MKASELREKETTELQELEGVLRQELFRLRMHLYTGQLESVATLKEKKRDIARVLTVLRERASADGQA